MFATKTDDTHTLKMINSNVMKQQNSTITMTTQRSIIRKTTQKSMAKRKPQKFNSLNYLTLFDAVTKGDAKDVEALIQTGVPINERNDFGETALHLAIKERGILWQIFTEILVFYLQRF